MLPPVGLLSSCLGLSRACAGPFTFCLVAHGPGLGRSPAILGHAGHVSSQFGARIIAKESSMF